MIHYVTIYGECCGTTTVKGDFTDEEMNVIKQLQSLYSEYEKKNGFGASIAIDSEKAQFDAN